MNLPKTGNLSRAGRALSHALADHRPQRLKAGDARPAAVLMPLWLHQDQVVVVFTKRTAHLANHAGQISFPGGARDVDDAGLAATALRETCEEIGVRPGQVEVLARLDQLITVTNFVVTPFIGLMDADIKFNLNHHEVERLIMPPLSMVFDESCYRHTVINWQGMEFKQRALEYDGDVIWGATARILLALLELLGPRAREVIRAAK